MLGLMEPFESWLIHRVAQAVEAGEAPGDLLTELRAGFDAARERPQEEGRTAAIHHIAGLAGVPEDEAATALAALEGQPTMTRELLMRRLAEAWLEG